MKSLTLVTSSLYSSCLWLFFASSLCTLCFCNQNSDKVRCIPTERMALIEFKNSLVDRPNRLSSWSGEDCCSWSGVVCDNFTHHVKELRLQGPDDGVNGHCNGLDETFYDIEEVKSQMLGGMISPSLIKLRQLRYLDLSCNDFGLTPIPAFIGSLQNLRYLNISKSRFAGEIPQQLGNLSALLVLDLHDYPFLSVYNIRSDNLKWIENLKQLQYLNMDGLNLTLASDWLQAINTLPSLQELHFSGCHLPQIPSDPTRVSFTSLTVLDLSYNVFYGNLFPGWVFNLHKLITLDLTGCFISGPNLRSQGDFDSMLSSRTLRVSHNTFVNASSFLNWLSNLSNLCNLTTLDLQYNNISGDVTELLERFCECESPKLESLALIDNNLTGQLPEKLGRLKNLVSIDIVENRLTGILPHSLGRLSLLKTLQLNGNQLEGSIPDSIGDLSSLESLDLSYNRLNGSLPESIGKLGKLSDLSLSGNFLTGIVTENHFANLTALNSLTVADSKLVFDMVNNWIPPFQLNELQIVSCSLGPLFPSWIQSQKYLQIVDLVNANISDTIPNWFWSTFSIVLSLNISHNNIMGKLGDVSTFLSAGVVLDLSFNNFHGELPRNFNKPNLYYLDLSYNNLSGSLDQFLCSGIQEPRELLILNLANNNISGGLPDCWINWDLEMLNLENNKLSGNIPSSLGNMSSLVALDMRKNKFSGEIPMSLFSSNSLLIVKLGENELTGRIPALIGRNDTTFKILSLRSNKLSGEIPNELCRLSSIQILDLADNNLSGYLPKCFTNFSVFSGKEKPTEVIFYNPDPYINEQFGSITLVIKGRFYSYSTIVYLVTALDLSNNKLSGSIPNELVSLPGLRYLNLSHNKLTGRISNTFGDMKELECLDLSVNHLDGEIPLSLAGLTSLSWLNVSYNNLTGRIPTGRQFQTFIDESFFIGNALCGAPLAACRPNSNNINGTNDNHDKDDGTDWILVICMTVGLAVGFWITIGTLVVSKQWRYAYYRFLDELWTKLSNFIFLVSM